MAEPAIGEPHGVKPASDPLRRSLYMAAGTLFLGLGAAGTVLPLLPTTPFLLLTAYCYSRSSKRLQHWLYTHPRFGPVLSDWEQHRSLSRRTKTIGIATVWIGIAGSILALHLTTATRLFPYLAALLLLVAISVSVFLATRPTGPLEKVYGGPSDD